jgi:DnaJ-class molecular chaperone
MRNCEECNGTGKTEVMNCHNQSNECCGGCYKEVKCEECDGSGEFKYWDDIEYEFQTMMRDWDLTREELNYLIENTNFKI